MNTDSIIDRVRKLQQLAKGNSNENEMHAALRVANKLMQEHRISQAQIEASGNIVDDEMVRITVSEGGRRTAWREVLIGALSDYYGCAFYVSSHRRGGERGQGAPGSKGVQSYMVCGRKSDTQILHYMFEYLEREIEKLGKAASKGKGISYAHSWLLGCAQGVAATFEKIKSEEKSSVAEGNAAAMILLDNRKKSANDYLAGKISMRPAAAIMGGRKFDGLSDGYSRGKQISVNPALK